MGIDYTAVGKRIKNLRLQCGLSQEELAEFCDISASFLGHIERGTRKMSLETLFSLCQALCVTPDVLLLEQLPVTDASLASFLSSLKFDTEEQKQRFFTIIHALAQIKSEL